MRAQYTLPEGFSRLAVYEVDEDNQPVEANVSALVGYYYEPTNTSVLIFEEGLGGCPFSFVKGKVEGPVCTFADADHWYEEFAIALCVHEDTDSIYASEAQLPAIKKALDRGLQNYDWEAVQDGELDTPEDFPIGGY